MLVCCATTRARAAPRSASASARRGAWSSASRATWWSSACKPAAARMPAWRMPPPTTLRQRRALLDQRLRAQQHRADRRAQALRQAHRHAVEVPGDLARRHALRDRGVEQARAVQVQRQSAPVAQRARLRAGSPCGSTRPCQVFSRHSRRVRAKCGSTRLDRAFDRVQRQRAVGRLHDRLRLDRAEHRRAAAFVLVGVRLHADEVFVAALAVRHQRRSGSTACRWATNRPASKPEVVRQALLQRVDRRVLAVDVVADRRRAASPRASPRWAG